eukprot:CAMPEP_0204317076 /NCGR_PEP_ID=MMETSP0469-20131031/5762_1 /ASSEMBLY_ACC=CAM_ASM_000384 /TAXON_ID=2969 /ORGANISM="Oxyrrhis marina" /LENGTH=69 /DNA_ID=CAMNT_0051297939 /DNA_START=66 /DNA_END=273 /DNA_ORIENTATION=+
MKTKQALISRGVSARAEGSKAPRAATLGNTTVPTPGSDTGTRATPGLRFGALSLRPGFAVPAGGPRPFG